MSSPTATRSRQLKLTMTPEMYARLVVLAEKLGQTPATLASVALSNYVATQEAALGATQRAIDTMVAQLMPQMLSQFTDGSELAQAFLPLESKGPAGTVGGGQ